MPDDEIADLAASFQATVVDTLVERTFAAAKWHNARAVGIAGGVSANSRLRAVAQARGERAELPVFVPSPHLSTDNAAMIAAAGLRKLAAGELAAAGSQRRRHAAALARNSLSEFRAGCQLSAIGDQQQCPPRWTSSRRVVLRQVFLPIADSR